MTDVTSNQGDESADTAGVWAAFGLVPATAQPSVTAQLLAALDAAGEAIGALGAAGVPAPAETPAEPAEDRFPDIDWDEAFTEDYADPEWMPGKLCERGQQVAVVGEAKVGKSLFMLAWAYACVAGSEFLGTAPVGGGPLKVLYFDMENNQRDVITRLKSFGATPEQLRGQFVYKLFPQFSGAFDENDAAVSELIAIVDEVKPDVLVLDTVSRFVGGSENDADTYTALYRRALLPLKHRGVTVARLDHMGKDVTKGARGSSAKTNDVDHVWELTAGDPVESPEDVVTNLKMRRSHTRSGIGPDLMRLIRRAVKDERGMWAPGGTSIALAGEASAADMAQAWSREAEGVPYSVTRKAMELLEAGLPVKTGSPSLAKAANELGIEVPGNKGAREAITREIKRLAPLRAQGSWHDPEETSM